MTMGDFNRIERKSVPVVKFSQPTLSYDPTVIRPVAEAPIYNPTYKVNPMFALKSKIIKWSLTALATIPEEYLWDLVKTVLDRLEKRMNDPKTPRWIKVAYVLLDNILASVDPRSPGGRTITKDELKKIIDDFWGR